MMVAIRGVFTRTSRIISRLDRSLVVFTIDCFRGGQLCRRSGSWSLLERAFLIFIGSGSSRACEPITE